MRTELIISIISFIGSAAQVKYLSLKRTSINISPFKKIIAGIFSWIFFLSTAAWMMLFGDTLAAWLTSPEDGQFLSVLISVAVFLCVYILSLRPSAPYPATEFLVFALSSLSFRSEASVSTNKLITFLRKREFDKFLKEVQPDTQNQIIQQRENLIEHLSQQQTITDELRQLENGTVVDIINANKPFPTMLSHHPFFKYLKRLTINPQERKVHLKLVNLQALEGTQLDADARVSFLRQVYDFIQATAHEPFIKQYARFFDVLSLTMFKFLTVDGSKKSEEPIFLFEISTTVLQKIESTYMNPSKLGTVATVQFRSIDTHVHSTEQTHSRQVSGITHQSANIPQHLSALIAP
jgi:hypothetical protein